MRVSTRLLLTSFILSAIVVTTMFSVGAAQQAGGAASKTLRVAVDDKGFHPPSLALKLNVPSKITFLRTADVPCATSVIIPDYKVNQDLPLNKPVVVNLTPRKAGEITFMCGMGMLKGKLVVAEK